MLSVKFRLLPIGRLSTLVRLLLAEPSRPTLTEDSAHLQTVFIPAIVRTWIILKVDGED